MKSIINSTSERVAARTLATLCNLRVEWSCVVEMLTNSSLHCHTDLHAAMYADTSISDRMMVILQPSLPSVWHDSFSTVCLFLAQRVAVELLVCEKQLRALLSSANPGEALSLMNLLLKRLTDVSRLAIFDALYSNSDGGNGNNSSQACKRSYAELATATAKLWTDNSARPWKQISAPPILPPQQQQMHPEVPKPSLNQVPSQPVEAPRASPPVKKMPTQSPFPNFTFMPRPTN